MPARLTIHYPTRPARVFPLPDDRPAVVGRDPDCDVVLDDDRISRRHARLSGRNADWSILDLESKNGTLVDGAPATEAPLGASSWVSFGGLIARFEALGDRSPDDRDLRRLTTALEARRALDPAVGLEILLPRVVSSMLELTGAERGCVILARADGSLEVAAQVGLAGGELGPDSFGGSLGAVRRVLESGEPVVSADARADAELGARASVVSGEIRALLSVPLEALDRRLGALYADSRKPGAVFTELDLEILQALASQAGLAIAVARLDRELKALAHRLEEVPDTDPALRRRLVREVTAVWERSLSPVRSGIPEPIGLATAPGSFP